MKQLLINFILDFSRWLLARRSMYSFNKLVFVLSLRGMGINNYENHRVSGEEWFCNKLKVYYGNDAITIFDIGANIGNYSMMVRQIFPNAIIHSFEPHPTHFIRLRKMAKYHSILAFNVGCGEFAGRMKLFDYKGQAASMHASMYKEVLEEIHKSEAADYDIEVVSLDNFCEKNNISKINLLKVDTEGYEFSVLRGSINLITKGLIDIIQFELGEMNTISRVFLKDFMKILFNYKLYRLLPQGMVSLEKYNPMFCEIFAFQNIVAIKKGINLSFIGN